MSLRQNLPQLCRTLYPHQAEARRQSTLHNTQAPGKITKPPSQHEKRGRPPVKPKLDKKEPEKAETALPASPSGQLFPPETEEERAMRERAAQ